MDEDRAGTVREWNSRSIEGHAGLRRLASEEFSGVIETDRGTVRAFMTNGAVVGIDGAGIGDLDGRHMTAYAAPDDAIPLLFAMQERGGEPRAQYYTEEMPLTEVDRTLEDGGFTGYVELSENVLSGDYYVVYHAGRSSSVAFVGSSSRLLTGDEAFERAADEVGIYDVVDVDVPVIDIPGDAGAVAGGGTATSSSGPSAGETADAAEPDSPGPVGDAGTGATDDAGDRGGPAPDDADGGDDGGDGPVTATDRPAGSDGRADAGGPYGTGEEIRVGAGLGTDEESTGAVGDEDGSGGAAADALDGAGTADSSTPGDRDDGATTDDTVAGVSDGGSAESPGGDDAARADRPDAPSAADSRRDADAVDRDAPPPARPAADEEDAGTADTAADAGTDERDARATDAGRSDRPAEGTGGDDSAGGHADPSGDRGDPAADGRSAADGASSGPNRDPLAAELRETREALERVRAERDDHRTDAERLRERVETLEARIEALEADGAATDTAVAADSAPSDDEGPPDESSVDDDGPAPDASGRSLDVDEAFAGTNLFVRYESKAEPTLEAAQGGDADPTAVNWNLRLEHHTRFEAAGAAVDGEPFESFLTSSFEYQFVEWVIRDLLYELRSTGNRMEMEQLYDAIPAVDRIHFHGEVQLDDGEATDANRFDVIFRDRMGGPLLVANLHESRDPTAAAAVTTLVEDARTVADAVGTLGAAFVVTTSYYEPPALDAASSATGGGFLSRSRKKSYVKLDRKRGFHLCLVEARDGEFNLTIPDL